MTNKQTVPDQDLLLQSFALAGYRSFGSEPQYVSRMAKITLLIGRNNSGKSNIIRFLLEVAPTALFGSPMKLGEIDAHRPSFPKAIIGWHEEVSSEKGATELRADHPLLNFRGGVGRDPRAREYALRIIQEYRKLGGQKTAWTFQDVESGIPLRELWSEALKVLGDGEMRFLWQALTEKSGGGRKEHWEPDVLRLIMVTPSSLNVALIPAIRHIRAGTADSTASHDGGGLVEELARLQNPDLSDQADRARFDAITTFVRNVLSNDEAVLDIPHNRSTILVKMDGKTLPIESLGTGIHEVIILAATATTLTRHLVCIEEPELHLNPILQRKLLRYLSAETDNQYVISTHSPAIMDTPSAEVYHIELIDRASRILRATSDRQRALICEDLGYHASDLLQANCILWVEGPSDRIYLKWWLANQRSDFVEGIHYSIMFYGGRLAAHLSAGDSECDVLTDFINLRRLNPRGLIVIDSDRRKKTAKLNSTKTRLQKEFDFGPGHAWITAGREIENYIDREAIVKATSAAHPTAIYDSEGSRYDAMLQLRNRAGSRVFQANKVEIARHVTNTAPIDLSLYDLAKQVSRLVDFIDQSNPA